VLLVSDKPVMVDADAKPAVIGASRNSATAVKVYKNILNSVYFNDAMAIVSEIGKSVNGSLGYYCFDIQFDLLVQY